METKGATYTGADVEIDGRIITAKGPKAAKEYGQTIAEMSSKNKIKLFIPSGWQNFNC